jgi:hypothetical protein
MKFYWSTFLSVLFLSALAGCGAEQFGTTPQSNASQANPLQVYQQSSCSGHTLDKPLVDILYVVDNSSSFSWISSSVKTSIQNTIGSISSQFDYRVIGTPLLKTSSGNEDYQVLAKDPTSLPVSVPSSKILSSYSQFSFFDSTAHPPIDPFDPEAGLKRVDEFVTAHSTNGLLRQNAYLLVVLVSNGKDYDIEKPGTGFNQAAFNARKDRFMNPTSGLKKFLNLKQFRILSVTANDKSLCSDPTGYYSSKKSYGDMSQAVYDEHGLPFKANADHYDLCGQDISRVFADVNSTIQQVTIPHTYAYWPITSTDGAIDTSPGKIKVYKSTANSAPVEMTSGWTYMANPGNQNTRILPTVGEPTTRSHLIKFNSGNYVTYPDCVSISTSSNLEYFGYIDIPKNPLLTSVVIKINGAQVPDSGWSLASGGSQTRNIKVAHNGYLDTPSVMRSGYMLKLTSSYYYKSGDNVEVYYVPESN